MGRPKGARNKSGTNKSKIVTKKIDVISGPINTYTVPSNVDKIVEERGSVYGPFENNAALSQRIKEAMQMSLNYNKLSPLHKEALDIIALKISRIVTGNDPNFLDHWDDIAGYATRVAKTIRGEK